MPGNIASFLPERAKLLMKKMPILAAAGIVLLVTLVWAGDGDVLYEKNSAVLTREDVGNCPSSNKMGHQIVLSIGGSGLFV